MIIYYLYNFNYDYKKNVLVCGDSHSIVYNGCNQIQNNIHFHMCCIPSSTSIGLLNNKSKTNARNIFLKVIKNVYYKCDKLLFLLGEVDCGSVIYNRSIKYNTSIEKQINI